MNRQVNDRIGINVHITLGDVKSTSLSQAVQGLKKPGLYIFIFLLMSVVIHYASVQRPGFEAADLKFTVNYMYFILFPTILALILIFFPSVLIYFALKREIRKGTLWSQPACLEFSKEQIQHITQSTVNTFGWESIISVVEYKSHFVIQSNKPAYILLPKRCFSDRDELQRFSALLKSSVKRNKRKLRHYSWGHFEPDAQVVFLGGVPGE